MAKGRLVGESFMVKFCSPNEHVPRYGDDEYVTIATKGSRCRHTVKNVAHEMTGFKTVSARMYALHRVPTPTTFGRDRHIFLTGFKTVSACMYATEVRTDG
ncbi:hypothetical protein AcW1_007239 [Taiwanofungus camphoratus]|nr:hypothetical protein AcW1_007239 [Antrodia cinnamomea]